MEESKVKFQLEKASDVPIYVQLLRQIRAYISNGTLQPGERLPSVRQLGEELDINFHTVSKVYEQLENEGLLEIFPASGVYVINIGKADYFSGRFAHIEKALTTMFSREKTVEIPGAEVMKVLPNYPSLIEIAQILLACCHLVYNKIEDAKNILEKIRENEAARLLIRSFTGKKKGAEISGKILKRGEPLVGKLIYLTAPANTTIHYALSVTDLSGRYHFHKVPSGEYATRCYDLGALSWHSWPIKINREKSIYELDEIESEYEGLKAPKENQRFYIKKLSSRGPAVFECFPFLSDSLYRFRLYPKYFDYSRSNILWESDYIDKPRAIFEGRLNSGRLISADKYRFCVLVSRGTNFGTSNRRLIRFR